MHPVHFFLALVVLAGGATSPLRAQVSVAGVSASRPSTASTDTVDATEGRRVRLSASNLKNPTLTGTLTSVRADSLWLRYSPSSAPTAFARTALTRLDVSGGHPGQGRRGLVGALVGATGGALLGAALGGGGGCIDCPPSETDHRRLKVAAFFGALGGFSGMLVGTATSGPERWYPGRLVSELP